MKNRTTPYGYGVQNGRICVSGMEGNVVIELFRAYASGASFKALAEQMRSKGIPYHDGDAAWDKNKIARILNCSTYLGTVEYPALIDRNLYEKARARKPACAISEETRMAKAVREIARCACCGGKIRMGAGRTGWTRWNCDECGALGANATTEKIMGQLEVAWLSLQEHMIREPQREEARDDALTRAESDFAAMLDEANFNETAAIEKALELAVARYDCISSSGYETMRIRRLIKEAPGTAGVDVNLLRSIAAAILIKPDGGVDIILKNRQTIGRDDAE